MKAKKNKVKKVYSSTAKMVCPRCGCETNHSLFDAEKGIYKCLVCKTLHA